MGNGMAANVDLTASQYSAACFTSMEDALFSLFGDGVRIARTRRIAGGDINKARELELTDGTRLFMKSNTKSNAPFFAAEAVGLEAIARTGTIGTPHIFCSGMDGKGEGYSFLLLEFLEGKRRIDNYWETFARQLAAMHRASAAELVAGGTYGFICDNYIGSGRQVNTAGDSWITFFRNCRLEPQFRKAEGYFDKAERKKISWLLEHLEYFLAEPVRASLLHGDLWSGNVMTGNDGKVWLIDPAVYVGHAEADIAMTELFGGFPQSFYDAYREAAPMQAGYERRRDLYNLYHLLNHLNLFGETYLAGVKRVLGKYMK
jgi:Fructosamine-3-kinase